MIKAIGRISIGKSAAIWIETNRWKLDERVFNFAAANLVFATGSTSTLPQISFHGQN